MSKLDFLVSHLEFYKVNCKVAQPNTNAKPMTTQMNGRILECKSTSKDMSFTVNLRLSMLESLMRFVTKFHPFSTFESGWKFTEWDKNCILANGYEKCSNQWVSMSINENESCLKYMIPLLYSLYSTFLQDCCFYTNGTKPEQVLPIEKMYAQRWPIHFDRANGVIFWMTLLQALPTFLWVWLLPWVSAWPQGGPQ